MAEKIQLISEGFSGWMESAQESLSKAGDGLDLLESQEMRLSGVWESEASRQWDMGFQRELLEVRQCIADVMGMLQKTEEAAEELLQIEKGLIREAEKL